MKSAGEARACGVGLPTGSDRQQLKGSLSWAAGGDRRFRRTRCVCERGREALPTTAQCASAARLAEEERTPEAPEPALWVQSRHRKTP